jgi:hypothetical protein
MDLHPQGDGGSDALAEAEAELRAVKTSLAILSQEKDEQGLSLSVLRKHLMQSMEQLTLLQQAIDSKLLKKPVTRSMAITARDKQRRAAAGVLIARNRALLMSLTHALAGMPSPVDPDSYVFSPEERAALLGSSSSVASGASGGGASTLRNMFDRSRQALGGGGGGGADDDTDSDAELEGAALQHVHGTHHTAHRTAVSGGPSLEAAGSSNTARLLSLLGDTVLQVGDHASSTNSPAASGGGGRAGGGSRGGGSIRGRTGSDFTTGALAEADDCHGGGGANGASLRHAAGDTDSLGLIAGGAAGRSQAASRAVRHCLRTSRVRHPLGDNPDVLCRVLSFLPHADLARAACVGRVWRLAALRSDCAVFRHLARSVRERSRGAGTFRCVWRGEGHRAGC